MRADGRGGRDYSHAICETNLRFPPRCPQMCVTSRLPCPRPMPKAGLESAQRGIGRTVAGSGWLAHADRRYRLQRTPGNASESARKGHRWGSGSAPRLDEFHPAKPERGPVLVYRHLPHCVEAELLQHGPAGVAVEFTGVLARSSLRIGEPDDGVAFRFPGDGPREFIHLGLADRK